MPKTVSVYGVRYNGLYNVHVRTGRRPLRIMPAEKLAEFGTFSG